MTTPSSTHLKLPWLMGTLLLVLGCGQTTTVPPASNFVYDGTNQSWSEAPTGVTKLNLVSGPNDLSAQPWQSANSSWGPIERNTSAGDKNAGDGKAMSMAGQAYAKGFGAHANSSMTFNIAGQCSAFSAFVGIDDEVGNRGSAVFQVLADGGELFNSKTMTGADAAQQVQVSLVGKQQLKLMVTDAGDGIKYDHADWAMPVVTCSSTPPLAIRINAGGTAQIINGQDWTGCSAVDACGNFVNGGFPFKESASIQGITTQEGQALYQTEWTGGQTTGVAAGQTAFEFKVPVPNGGYQVKLHFAELNQTSPGKRLFDVKLEDKTVLDNFDIFAAAGGANQPLIRSFPVTVGDGVMNIAFLRELENAKISGIEILADAPTEPSATPGVLDKLPAELVFSAVQGETSPVQNLTFKNAGTGALTINTLTPSGAFGLVNAPTLPLTLAAGQSAAVGVQFSPQAVVGSLSGDLQIGTTVGSAAVKLYGLSARGLEGENEPPLQQVINTLGYKIDVGSTALILGTENTLKGDEVRVPVFQKAGSGPVTVRVVARYSPDGLFPFGYVSSGSSDLKKVGTVALKQYQTLNPTLTAESQSSFDPGSASFSFYAGRTSYANYETYTDDNRNTASGQLKHGMRVYPLKDRAGTPIPNSYLIGVEASANGDYNDYVFMVQNVTPVKSAAALSWKQQAGALTAVFESQGTAVGNKLYVFGGFTNGLVGSTKAQAYDAPTNRWAALKDVPEPLTHAAVAEDGSTIYIAGGFIGNHPGPQTNHVWKYDTLTNTWSKGTPLPGARGGGALVRIGRILHFVGGVERDLSDLKTYKRDSPEHWTLNLDGGANATWQTAAPMPNPRNHTAGVNLNGQLYVLGGQHLSDEINGTQKEVDRYDPQTNTWTRLADLPRATSHTSDSTVVWNNRIVMVAGVSANSEEIADVKEYDPATDTWRALPSLAAPRQSPVAGVINGRLYVTTGSLPSGIFNTTWVGDLP